MAAWCFQQSIFNNKFIPPLCLAYCIKGHYSELYIMVNIDISEENNAEKDGTNNNNQPKDEKICRVIWQVIDV